MPFIDTPETNALKSKVEKILSEIPDFTDENKNLKINVIKDYADNGNVKLLEPLLKNPQTKKAFFTPILDSFVFNTAKFKEFLEYSSACNSYSKYLGQKIGLYMGDSSLLDRNEVVLNFPFKDCVLEGGQRKEDGLDTYYEYNEKKGEYEKKQSKRREDFYNEVLAQDEIDSLFSPKAFCNTKRYEKSSHSELVSESTCTKLNRDTELNKKRGLAEDTITDNLIIKGNNLLALHSLKKEFAGKVKLIYIDPPYNTGSDSFAYNDNFNHSSWLTFMKNRLEVAKELLREDGCIFVQCDDNEQAYLKILCDEVFGRVNFISSIVWKGRGGRQDSKFIAQIHETIQVFAKNINSLAIYKEEVADDDSYTGKDEKGEYKLQLLRKWGSNSRRIDRPNLYFGVDFEGETVFPILPDGSDGCWRWSKSKIESAIKENLIVLQNKNDKIELYEKIYKTGDTKEKVFTSWFEECFSGEAANHLKDLFNEKVFDFPKPESLLKRILEISTKPTDIVLDYHLGSGTTTAVAHKMNRQYIGIEQMDYIESVTVERLKKVIEGEQGGISKSQNWQGGGSFVYLELAKKNETALEQISACKSLEELTELFDELCSKYFLHYNVRVKEFRKEIESERFKQLNLKQQKEMFSRMLDLNQLYVNTDDRHDKNTGLTEDDIAITEDFYQLK